MVYLKGQDNWHEIEFSESGTGAGAATDLVVYDTQRPQRVHGDDVNYIK